MTGPVIREATPDDLDAVVMLWKTLEDGQDAHRALAKAADADDRFLHSFRSALDDPHAAWFVAERDGGIVGMAYAHVELPSRMSDEAVLELSRVVVTPSERGRGVAAALIRRSEEMARSVGAARLGVKVFVSNAEAASFWAHAGFRPAMTLSLRPVLPVARPGEFP